MSTIAEGMETPAKWGIVTSEQEIWQRYMLRKPAIAEVATQLIRHPELLSTTMWNQQSSLMKARKSLIINLMLVSIK